MAKQDLNLGNANQGDGDTLRGGGVKIKANFDEIYAEFGDGTNLSNANTAGDILVADGSKFVNRTTSGDITISNTGAINLRNNQLTIAQGSDPGSGNRDDKLYNIGGTLYWDGTAVGVAGGSAISGFNVAGDTGTDAVQDGNTVKIATGSGLSSSAADASGTPTVTISLDLTTGLTFEGATANDFETTLAVTDPTADRTITLPDATDTLVGKATTDVLTNKTLTSAVLNTGVSGSAILDSDTMSGASATTLSSSESIKAYVDANALSLIDEDNMSTDSATRPPSQQSVKAYVDANALSLIDEDNMSTNSATRPPSQQSVKAYVDANAGSTITVQDEGSALSTGATTLNFVGAGVTASGNAATKTITIAGGGATNLNALTDATVASANAGQILLHDGSDSFDNKDVKVNNVTLDQTAALAIPMGAAVYTISANGSTAYLFNDYESDGSNGSNEHLYLLADLTYIFDLRALAGSHPFQIQASNSALTTSNGADGLIHIANNGTVSTGTSANAKTEGFLIWKVPHFATASTGTYRYICTSHSNMVGSITIKTLEQLS